MYSVRWAPSALSDLAEFWTDADDTSRRSITDTVAYIDSVLKNQAVTAGESRDPGYRIFLAAPLGVDYAVDESKHLAYVIRVWEIS